MLSPLDGRFKLLVAAVDFALEEPIALAPIARTRNQHEGPVHKSVRDCLVDLLVSAGGAVHLGTVLLEVVLVHGLDPVAPHTKVPVWPLAVGFNHMQRELAQGLLLFPALRTLVGSLLFWFLLYASGGLFAEELFGLRRFLLRLWCVAVRLPKLVRPSVGNPEQL